MRVIWCFIVPPLGDFGRERGAMRVKKELGEPTNNSEVGARRVQGGCKEGARRVQGGCKEGARRG